MNGKQGTARSLIFTWGNPSRGDDAIGPLFYEKCQDLMESGELEDVEVLTDFQLQIEHAMDLLDREQVFFVDASIYATPPFEFKPIMPRQDDSFTSHGMTPQAILSVYQNISDTPLPECYLLEIRGYEFELGADITSAARQNLAAAITAIKQKIRNKAPKINTKLISNY